MNNSWSTWILMSAVALSLILNLVALSRIGDLRSEVNTVRSEASEVHTLQTRVSEMERHVSEAAEEQGLVTNVLWDIDDVNDIDCDAGVPVTVSWTFRELPANANVLLELRHAGQDGWVQIEAEQTGDVDFLAQHEMRITDDWEYRIVATGEYETRATEPDTAQYLRHLNDQRVMFEGAETREQNGQSWMRFMLVPQAAQLSQCNEIVNATMTLLDGDEQLKTVALHPGHPGDHLPDGYEAESDEPSGRSNTSGGTSFDIAFPVPGNDRVPDKDDYWWTDWVRIDPPVDHRVEIEFGDGTVRTINEMGLH